MAKLYFRYGAMNSGKTTNLLQVAHNYKERGMSSIIIKPLTDIKGGNKVVSRLGVTHEVDMLINKEQNMLREVENWILEKGPIHCVLVDEAQFFTRDHIDQMFEIAVKLDIPVICYGLRTDFKVNGFEGSERLLLLAHSIEELKTICTCGRKAILNGRKVNGEFVFEGQQIAIDNEDDVTYQSLCAQCYYKYRGDMV